MAVDDTSMRFPHADAPSVLVVAPPSPHRESIVFLIVVEGFEVITEDVWPPVRPLSEFHCVVLDEAAVADIAHAHSDLVSIGRRLIFMHSNNNYVHRLDRAKLVLKPPLDRALIDAVVRAASGDTIH